MDLPSKGVSVFSIQCEEFVGIASDGPGRFVGDGDQYLVDVVFLSPHIEDGAVSVIDQGGEGLSRWNAIGPDLDDFLVEPDDIFKAGCPEAIALSEDDPVFGQNQVFSFLAGIPARNFGVNFLCDPFWVAELGQVFYHRMGLGRANMNSRSDQVDNGDQTQKKADADPNPSPRAELIGFQQEGHEMPLEAGGFPDDFIQNFFLNVRRNALDVSCHCGCFLTVWGFNQKIFPPNFQGIVIGFNLLPAIVMDRDIFKACVVDFITLDGDEILKQISGPVGIGEVTSFDLKGPEGKIIKVPQKHDIGHADQKKQYEGSDYSSFVDVPDGCGYIAFFHGFSFA